MIQDGLLNKDEKYSPLLVCYDGGVVSETVALIIKQLGYHPVILKGGFLRIEEFKLCLNFAYNFALFSI